MPIGVLSSYQQRKQCYFSLKQRIFNSELLSFLHFSACLRKHPNAHFQHFGQKEAKNPQT